MHITPRFTLSQTSTHVILTLTLPYIRVGSAETLIDGPNLTFTCQSYLLKLTFSNVLLDDDDHQVNAIYDPNVNNGTLSINIFKLNEGEDFNDLDLTTKLLQPKLPKKYTPKIEIIESNEDKDEDSDDEEFEDEVSVLEHLKAIEIEGEEKKVKPKYGFNLTFTNEHSQIRPELREISAVDLDVIGWSEKRELRLTKELEDFDRNRYQSDYFINDIKFEEFNPEGHDMLYTVAMNHAPWWFDDLSFELKSLTLEADDTEVLSKIPNKLQTIQNPKPLFLGLISILFSYILDTRLTDNEPTVESAFNLWKCSSIFNWFESYHGSRDDVKMCLVEGVRRGLCYGYCRNFELCLKGVEDLVEVMGVRRKVIKCFIEIYRIFEKSDVYYLMNRFYVEPYLVFLQNRTEEEMKEFGEEVKACWMGEKRNLEKFKESVFEGLREMEVEVEESVESNSSED
ncbi:hypothetical protein TrLO_g5555 [Triparma laevis f. longispina]|uniref:CS domain-containing protein n=1 Tax=Triparma laevis f. longispina TaxID=1714387 RepID=A0A9W7C5E8_9STRA|nr:hypothetical protein TrLO_g5555 [Triparma laevis f. longispina]